MMNISRLLEEFNNSKLHHDYIQFLSDKLSPSHSSDRVFYNCAHILSILLSAIKKHVDNLKSCSMEESFDMKFSLNLSAKFSGAIVSNLNSVTEYITKQPVFFRVYFNRGMYRRLRTAYDAAANYRFVNQTQQDEDPDCEVFSRLGIMLQSVFDEMKKGDIFHTLHDDGPDPIYKVFQEKMGMMENLTDSNAAKVLQSYLEVGTLRSFEALIRQLFSTHDEPVSFCCNCLHALMLCIRFEFKG